MTTEQNATRHPLVLGGTGKKLVRFSYLHVHEPKLNSESAAMEYSVMLLIPKTNTEDIAAIKKAIAAIQQELWLKEGKKLPPLFWNPLRDGDTGTKQDGSEFGPECRGHFLLNCKTGEKYPPNVVGTRRGADGKFIELGPRDIKSGDYGRAKVDLKGYTKGTGGVGVYLSSVQLVREGDALSGGSSAEQDFAGFADEDDESAMLE